MTTLLSGEYIGQIVPYQRMTHDGRFTPRAKRYHRSQNRLIAHMCEQLDNTGLLAVAAKKCVITTPYRFDLTIYVPPTQKGSIPKDAGDLDNFAKAWVDAAQHGKIVMQDNLYWYRGLDVDVIESDSWRFVWRFWRRG